MTTSRSERPHILIVDDEEQVTRSLRLVLRKQFNVKTASSGEEGLEQLERDNSFAVIVSDMRMPGINGAEFLSRSRDLAPEAVRILLTGQADAESAMAAVNEGRVFRFMSKPCSPTALRAALEEAVAHRALKSAERDVLEQTLTSLGLVLSEVIGLVHPIAAQRSEKMRSVVNAVAGQVGFDARWRVELAAALSHLGCAALPSDLVDTALRGERLTSSKREAWLGQGEFGASLIENVPRLEWVAEMIRAHMTPTPELKQGAPFGEWPEVVRGAELLRTANAYAMHLVIDGSRKAALESLAAEESYAPEFIAALGELPEEVAGGRDLNVRADRLREGMVLLEDMQSREGVALCCAGAVVTGTVLKLALNFSVRGELREPLRVRLAPESESEEDSQAA